MGLNEHLGDREDVGNTSKAYQRLNVDRDFVPYKPFPHQGWTVENYVRVPVTVYYYRLKDGESIGPFDTEDAAEHDSATAEAQGY